MPAFFFNIPQGDHNMVENMNKLIKNVLSFTWFVFCAVVLTYGAALLSCTELVCARANLNYANFFLNKFIHVLNYRAIFI